MSTASVEHLGLLYEALQTLYSNSSRKEKEQANHFLEEFQKSKDAWVVTHAVLRDNKASVEAKLFAAQTLRNKINFDFHQLSSENLPLLRDSLLQLILLYHSGPKPIMIQLCVALAGLALQMLEWKDVIRDVVSVLGKDKSTWGCLLQFISVLPEEVDNKKCLLSEEELSLRSKELLSDNLDKVIELLLLYVQNIDVNVPINPLIFDCINSWLKETSINNLISTPLLDFIFVSLSSDNVLESVVDLLCSIFRETSDVDESLTVIEELYSRLQTLKPKIIESKNDPDVFRSYARLFCEAGETWVVLIARSPQHFRPLVECIAVFAELDDELEIVKYGFNFWYDLKQLLVLKAYAEARIIFSDIYSNLVDIMIRDLHYPDGNPEDLFDGDRESEERFRNFRHQIGDVLKDCCAVVGDDVCLKKAFEKVKKLLNDNENGMHVRWQEIEAPLFSMRAMAREVNIDNNQVLPEIMTIFTKLPNHEKIVYAATLLLGRYTEWTANHPEYLEFQLNYICNGFRASNRGIISAASQALKHFCQDCKKAIIIPDLFILSPVLDADSLFDVTEGVAYLVSAQPAHQIYDTLKLFCDPIVKNLLSMLQKCDTDTKFYQSVADEIELLTIFAQTVSPYIPIDQQHPCVMLFQELWPVISHLLDVYGSSLVVSESICKFFKALFNSYREHMLVFLPFLAEKLVMCFEKTEYGCFLWVSGACIRIFSNVETCSENTRTSVWQFTERQCLAMFSILNRTNPKEIPDVIDDFFRLLIDALLGYSVCLITSSLLDLVFQASLVSLSLELPDPLISVLHFLRDLLSYCFSSPVSTFNETPLELQTIVRNIVQKYNQQLITSIFYGLAYSFPRDCVPDASGVLLSLIEIYPEDSIKNIGIALNHFPSETISPQEKTRLLNDLTATAIQTNWKKVRRLLQDWLAFYRRRVVTPRNKTFHLKSFDDYFHWFFQTAFVMLLLSNDFLYFKLAKGSYFRSNYSFPEKTYNDIKDLIDSYPTIEFWIENYEFEKYKEQRVLAVKVVFPIIFHDNSYDIPVVLWVPLLYPQKAPAVLIVSEEGTVIKQNSYIDSYGYCHHPCLEFWNECSNDSLIHLCISLRNAFSKDIPIIFQASSCASQTSTDIPRSFSFIFPKNSLDNYNLFVKSDEIMSSTSAFKSEASVEQSFPPPLPNKPSSFLAKSSHLQQDISSGLMKKTPINILDSPDVDVQAYNLSSLSIDSIKKPLNPVNAQLIKQIAIILQENAEKTLKTIAQLLLQVKSDREKILRSQTQIEREMTELFHFKEQCEKKILILKKKIQTSRSLIEKYKGMKEPLIDDIIIPQNSLSKQFYDLVSDEKSIEDTIYVLWRLLEEERIDLDIFLKHTRNLAQEQFMKKVLIKKINKELGASE
ncbi:hypothetical protein PORY_001885 [Pneumocystis oryctolagi]|uniref:Uncharacterized protein n=1 Tax=Pneumocystis oryctolagi TaxID=42067 RepID=A0ACB7CAS4_9ASCO|nr:hypothetical protein PORY_001885 [Pneumocystis oryctolagi]